MNCIRFASQLSTMYVVVRCIIFSSEILRFIVGLIGERVYRLVRNRGARISDILSRFSRITFFPSHFVIFISFYFSCKLTPGHKLSSLHCLAPCLFAKILISCNTNFIDIGLQLPDFQ